MNSSASRFDVALSAYPLNYAKGLRERQIPVLKPLGNSLLRHFTINDPNSYLPVHVLCSFFKEVRAQYGLEFFTQQYLRHLKLENMGISGEFMISNNRVLPTLQYFSKYGGLLCTNQDIQLSIKGTHVFCSNRFYGDSSIEKNTMEYIWVFMLLDLLKTAEGPIWAPWGIQFTGKECEYPKLDIIPEKTNVSFNQEVVGIRFKTSTLTKHFRKGKGRELSENMLKPPALSLSGKIEYLFDKLYSTNLPSLQATAECFGVSVSTLKRHLATEQLTYHELLERWRFMKGVNLLTETSLKIKEISDCLYYANSANFIRAFKRWSGKSPKEFRDAC